MTRTNDVVVLGRTLYPGPCTSIDSMSGSFPFQTRHRTRRAGRMYGHSLAEDHKDLGTSNPNNAKRNCPDSDCISSDPFSNRGTHLYAVLAL